MFISDTLAYLDLHKTGCTYIRKALKKYVGGELVGKHNQATPDLFDGRRKFLGSVRNPWEWYLSLWAYGCDRKGGVYTRSTVKVPMKLQGLGWGRNPAAALGNLRARFERRWRHDSEFWLQLYADVNDAEAFRQWVRALYQPKYSYALAEGFSDLSMSSFVGYFTYRYITLFCCVEGDCRMSDISSYEELNAFHQDSCFIDYFIKTENLNGDFINALEFANIKLSEAQKNEILEAAKINTSVRKNDLSYYYDEATEQFLLDKERLLVETFEYVAPSAQRAAALMNPTAVE